jgi:hypothetical protein
MEIWHSMRRMPVWVQIWMFFILVPVNFAAVFFLGQPFGILIACLAIGGILPNLPIMAWTRGFSSLMALPHVIIWTPLVIIIAWVLISVDGLRPIYSAYLWVLLVTDLVSLAFDYPDFRKWLRGERANA